MRNIWTIARREYKLYFSTPIAYAVAFLFFLIMGWFVYADLRDALIMAMTQPYSPDVKMITGSIMVFLLIFTMPAITMRLIAEEGRTGTLELMLTAPVRDAELVIGKWLGAWMFMLTLLAVTWVYPLILNAMSQPGIDQGPLLTGYLGLVLMVASLIAIGVAVSSIFNNQIAAFFVSLALVLFFWFVRPGSGSLGASAEILNYMNFIDHYVNFWQGVIELKDVVYYLSVTALFLFLGSISVEIRRWR
jgi:ABC-2 type transport system permease protein